MANLRRDHPGRAVELWAEDEARLRLKPIARRAWAVKGRTKYQWLYVYIDLDAADRSLQKPSRLSADDDTFLQGVASMNSLRMSNFGRVRQTHWTWESTSYRGRKRARINAWDLQAGGSSFAGKIRRTSGLRGSTEES